MSARKAEDVSVSVGNRSFCEFVVQSLAHSEVFGSLDQGHQVLVFVPGVFHLDEVLIWLPERPRHALARHRMLDFILFVAVVVVHALKLISV